MTCQGTGVIPCQGTESSSSQEIPSGSSRMIQTPPPAQAPMIVVAVPLIQHQPDQVESRHKVLPETQFFQFSATHTASLLPYQSVHTSLSELQTRLLPLWFEENSYTSKERTSPVPHALVVSSYNGVTCPCHVVTDVIRPEPVPEDERWEDVMPPNATSMSWICWSRNLD